MARPDIAGHAGLLVPRAVTAARKCDGQAAVSCPSRPFHPVATPGQRAAARINRCPDLIGRHGDHCNLGDQRMVVDAMDINVGGCRWRQGAALGLTSEKAVSSVRVGLSGSRLARAGNATGAPCCKTPGSIGDCGALCIAAGAGRHAGTTTGE